MPARGLSDKNTQVPSFDLLRGRKRFNTDDVLFLGLSNSVKFRVETEELTVRTNGF